ncbi:hypothetical protein [Singulisphaera acidiphila]|uniref:Uncharacterized protein n=1 Tax=Singulisphaera acidiphila (strain ATCC BAA-1392 / DSM 18658 / VKM B-2454 / MOB10) TaxID=886293 RepID=L0DI22_SINAD|nr:hypothetical protein [Singulisphaera acidiphila]AGA28500.1 hypothetical protein Sinac_4301 [Singulisphaera acidiphila DSM 18658]
MPFLNPVPEDQLRDALRAYRVEPGRFEAAVRERLETVDRRRQDDPLACFSPFLRGVAALLPLPFFTGCRASEAAAKTVPVAGGVKLFGYLAFPAISLFVLLGASIFSVAKIHGIQRKNHPGLDDAHAESDAVLLWWKRHQWPAYLVFAATIALVWIGATWLLFLFYIISFGVLLYVLSSFARFGLGNRLLIGQSCMAGLMLLGQLTASFSAGDNDIHFLDQKVIAVVFFGGAMLVLACYARDLNGLAGRRVSPVVRWPSAALLALLLISLSAWFLNPLLRPATPARIKAFVESFHEAPYSTSSWRSWEIVARWAIESKLDPDLSGARRLLAREIAGEQNPFILGNAFRVGLIRADQIRLLRDYESRRHSLFDDPHQIQVKQPILSLSQEDWVIRASILLGNLTAQDRDYLEKRLLTTLDGLMAKGPYDVIAETLLVTRLLEAIDRPADPARYRDRVHKWLRKFHSRSGGGFQLAGGFKTYLKAPVGSVETTASAVELMEVYGVPDGLDLNWVRSFLKPMAFIRQSDEKWITAVSLDRLNRLPGARRPTWPEILYHERSLIAAMVLVGLCLYATLSSPNRRPSTEEIRAA